MEYVGSLAFFWVFSGILAGSVRGYVLFSSDMPSLWKHAESWRQAHQLLGWPYCRLEHCCISNMTGLNYGS